MDAFAKDMYNNMALPHVAALTNGELQPIFININDYILTTHFFIEACSQIFETIKRL